MDGETSTQVACPICGTEIQVPLSLTYRRGHDAVVTMHDEGIRLHVGLAHGGDQ